MYMSRKRLVIEDFSERAEISKNRLIAENGPKRMKISAIANCSGELGEAEHGDCRFRKMASADTDTFGCFVVQSIWISAPACSEKYVKNHKYVDSGSKGITREKITVTVISEHSLPSTKAPFPGQYYVMAAHFIIGEMK